MMGVDKTQGLALDEIFSRKSSKNVVRQKTVVRNSNGANVEVTIEGRAFRKTRVTTVASETEKRPSKLQVASADGSEVAEEIEDTGEIVMVPTGVCHGAGLCGPGVRANLICMTWLWTATTIDYFIINFYLKYIPGSEFLNFSIAGLSEIFAHVAVGALYEKVGPRFGFLIGYSIALCGSIPLFFQNKLDSIDGAGGVAAIATFVLLAKFGCSACYCICYISTPTLFPTRLAATAFGVCNLVGRTLGALSPVIAEMKVPYPMAIFSVMAIISIFFALPLKPYETNEEEKEALDELLHGSNKPNSIV